MKRGLALAALALAGAVLSTPAASATNQGRAVPVKGNWVDEVPCIPTSYEPGIDPTNGPFTATCTSIWTGSWTGVTEAHDDGYVNFLTGDASGTIEETFTGRAEDGGSGTLRLRESFRVIGKTSALHIDAEILGGTGDFRGSKGHVTFDGTVPAAGAGAGTYVGSWIRSGGSQQPRPTERHAARLRVSVAPRRVRVGKRTRFRFRVTVGGTPARHARLRFAGRSVRTNRRGRAALVSRLLRTGRYRAVARGRGLRPGRATVRAIAPRSS